MKGRGNDYDRAPARPGGVFVCVCACAYVHVVAEGERGRGLQFAIPVPRSISICSPSVLVYIDTVRCGRMSVYGGWIRDMGI